VTNRRKNLILIQLTIFFVAFGLLYNTYSDKTKKKESSIKIELETNPDTNSFTDIEYSGFDLEGNRYVLNAKQANFKTITPELVNMMGVVAKFYLKDNTILTVNSDEGIYNNVTLDMKFKKNVKADYLTNTLLSDLLYYSNKNGKLTSSGNVKGKSVDKGEFSADNVEYDIKDKSLNFSMFGSDLVNVKIKN